jgi:hypothetical protein
MSATPVARDARLRATAKDESRQRRSPTGSSYRRYRNEAHATARRDTSTAVASDEELQRARVVEDWRRLAPTLSPP